MAGNPRKKDFWRNVLSKIRKRLSRWKGIFLSLTGRIDLIKSVITSLPLDYLPIFKAPTTVAKEIYGGGGHDLER